MTEADRNAALDQSQLYAGGPILENVDRAFFTELVPNSFLQARQVTASLDLDELNQRIKDRKEFTDYLWGEYVRNDCIAVEESAGALDLLGSGLGYVGYLQRIGITPAERVVGSIAAELSAIARYLKVRKGLHKAQRRCQNIYNRIQGEFKSIDQLYDEFSREWSDEVGFYNQSVPRKTQREDQIKQVRQELRELELRRKALDPGAPPITVPMRRFRATASASEHNMRAGAEQLIQALGQ